MKRQMVGLVNQLPMERSPEDLKVALACELGDGAVFRRISIDASG